MHIPVNIHASWQHHLAPLFQFPGMVELNTKILPKCKFYPKAEHIFNVFRMPLNEVRVVILGQDPYPKQNQAIGYAFAVSESQSIPYSLRNIQQELVQDFYGKPEQEQILRNMESSTWKTLIHWRQQGVFLLNTALTVEQNRPDSHAKLWKPFIKEVIKILAAQNVIWLLWGANATEYKQLIASYCTENPDILIAGHPAAGFHGSETFLGCKHFSFVNDLLESKNKKKIIW